MSVKTEVTRLLQDSLLLCCGIPRAKPLEDALVQLLERLQQPLQVAVIGIVNAGKSTFLNALMGAPVLATGDRETTYTVCWFRYGEVPSLTVCFRDGKEAQVPFSQLHRWSVRGEGDPMLDQVRKLIVYYPSPLLKQIELVDTPGMDSIYGTDQQNTLDLLAIRSSQDTLQEAAQADAVIYAFSQTLQEYDLQTLSSFRGEGGASPIHSIGILTKADTITPASPDRSAMDQAKEEAAKQMANPQLKRLLYHIYPVSAKTLDGCRQMEPEDWTCLKALLSVEAGYREELLQLADIFSSYEDPECPNLPSAKDRRKLVEKLGLFGIREALSLLQKGFAPAQIEEQLRIICGIREIEEVLQRHFGGRAFLIKTRYVFDYLRTLLRQIENQEDTESPLRGICETIRGNIADLENSLLVMQELSLLQRYYNGELSFTQTEEQEFLHLTGELGRELETRLNVSAGTTVAQMRNLTAQRIRDWRRKAQDWTRDSRFQYGARQIARIYETLHYHLQRLCEEIE